MCRTLLLPRLGGAAADTKAPLIRVVDQTKRIDLIVMLAGRETQQLSAGSNTSPRLAIGPRMPCA